MISTKDVLWKHIITKCNIDLTKRISLISADDIKNCKKSWEGKENQFEPRLLCKIDSYEKNPQIFKENNISILSVKNGIYSLVKDNIYIQVNKILTPAKKIENKNNSILLGNITSENDILDNLLHNKILEEIIGEKVNYGPIFGGRHRCSFKTVLGEKELEIKGSQYETDGCYETDNFICIVEVKSCEIKSFNVRQLYYPFREIHKKVGDKKKIISLFIYRDKDDYIHIHKYKWNDFRRMTDIKEIGYYKYINSKL
jgi:hypothetical protein